MKKISIIILTLMLLFSAVPTVFGQDVESISIEREIGFTTSDIMGLEKYISVNKKGFFELDYLLAVRDNIQKELLEGQQNYFNELNKLIAENKLIAFPDLTIKSNIKDQLDLNIQLNKSSCDGVTKPTEYHWWGYSRLLDSCNANGLAADLAGAASISAGAAVIAGIFGGVAAVPPGIAAAYWGLVSARIYANNSHSTGIYFGMTWVYVFNIEPQ